MVVAHCASLGNADIEDSRAMAQTNFALFGQLMDEAGYRKNLVGDIAAITQGKPMGVAADLLQRPDWHDWHDRLLNGSDSPLPGVVPLISMQALVDNDLLVRDAVEPLRSLRDINALLCDFVLKRSLAFKRQGFARPVFETATFFRRPG